MAQANDCQLRRREAAGRALGALGSPGGRAWPLSSHPPPLAWHGRPVRHQPEESHGAQRPSVSPARPCLGDKRPRWPWPARGRPAGHAD